MSTIAACVMDVRQSDLLCKYLHYMCNRAFESLVVMIELTRGEICMDSYVVESKRSTRSEKARNMKQK